jgi:ferredoxin-type protein NapH
VLAVIAYKGDVTQSLRFLWSGPFHIFIRVSLVAACCFVVFRWISRRSLVLKSLKWIYGIFFLPLLVLPFFRCSFTVPFVFCSVCPTKCPWGLSRSFMFNSFIFLNLFGRSWCSSFCPLGTYQECQARIVRRPLKLPAWTGVAAYLTALMIAVLYFLPVVKPRAVVAFMTGYYEWGAITVAVVATIFAAAFFIPRFWCRYFCPVGTIAALTARFSHRSSK